MTGLGSLIRRNCKLFFKDKGLFLSSLITPMILLVLYGTFLANVYKDSFSQAIPKDFSIDASIIDAMVGGQLFSSLLAVCCVTIPFCCNFVMVGDKMTGARRDLTMTPVKKSTLALSYYISTAISSLFICYIAVGACFIYMGNLGWYLSGKDVALLMVDVFILVMFGTALSSVVNHFLSSQGQITAVETIISAGYGFIAGAYMPISQFGDGVQKVVSFLPCTYGTSLIRNHTLRGVYEEMSDVGVPNMVLEEIKDSIDCNLYFMDNKVAIGTMYQIVIISVIVLIAVYIMLSYFRKNNK